MTINIPLVASRTWLFAVTFDLACMTRLACPFASSRWTALEGFPVKAKMTLQTITITKSARNRINSQVYEIKTTFSESDTIGEDRLDQIPETSRLLDAYHGSERPGIYVFAGISLETWPLKPTKATGQKE